MTQHQSPINQEINQSVNYINKLLSSTLLNCIDQVKKNWEDEPTENKKFSIVLNS